jgi:hypothetical protein
MNDPEISEIIRGVSLAALMSVDGMPADLAAKVQAMLEIGATTVDVASVLSEDGWRIIMVPAGAEIEIQFGEPEEDPEDVEAGYGYESDKDYFEDAPSGGLSGLLDRLRSVFGKSISFEVENAIISRNRKRAAARQPHDFQRAIWATRKGSIRCRICGGAQPEEGLLCGGVTLKDGHEWVDPDPNEAMLDVGELTLRSATLAQAHDMIAETLGWWPQSEAHYLEENPFLDEGIACLNCVAYYPEEEACCWVEGMIAPTALCKLWVIPDSLRKSVPISKEIVEQDGEFCVTSADGSRSFGCYATEEEAQQRLAQIEQFSKADTFAPPDGVKAEAAKAERWIEEGHAGSGFTATGRRRAADLAAGNPVSLDTIKRIASYLARHEADKQGEGWSPGEPGFPSPGRVAWAAWGGDPAISWTRGILDSMEKGNPSVSEVHVDVPMGSGGRQKKKPEAIPSIFSKADDRRFTLGPWYVPDAYDAHGEWTDAEELQTALWDYVRSGDRQIRLQHNVEVVAGEWVEALAWPYAVRVPMLDVETGSVVEHEFPENTIFMGVVWEPWAWNLVKQGKIRGYSMGGSGQRVLVDLPSEESE